MLTEPLSLEPASQDDDDEDVHAGENTSKHTNVK